MNRNEDKEFDLIMRSMLYDAQEEVPSRVWENCEAALGQQRSPVTLWWRRAAIGVAAAAAIAGIVMVAVKPDPGNVGTNLVAGAGTPETIEVPETVQTTAPAIGTANLVADAHIAAKPRPAAIPRDINAFPVESPSEAATDNNTDTADNIIQESSMPIQEQEETVVPSVTDYPATDPFAEMEFEDSRKARGNRLSLGAGGQMLTNGNPAAVAAFNGRRAQAAAPPTSTGVKQTSTNSIYAVPISFGLSVNYSFNDRWSISSGLIWSMMERTFTGVYTEVTDGAVTNVINTDIHNTLHYIGIPLNVQYNIISGGRFSMYAFAGGTAEKGVTSNFRLSSSSGKAISFDEGIDGVQFSAGAGFGIQFNLSDHVGIYVDPSLRYWFDCGQPTSIRTQQPLMMGFEAGLRFRL